jgi:hypothetical protein
MDKCVEQPTARHHGRAHPAAAASHGHAAHPSQGAHASSSPAAHAHASHVGGPPAHAAAPAPSAAKPATKPEPRKEEEARSDTGTPNLGPVVPGLDSAVIPTPLVGVRSTWGTTKEAAPATKPDPVSDPDGVLEH